MPHTLYEIDLNHCRYYLGVFEGLDAICKREGFDEAFETLWEKWPNIRKAQAWLTSLGTSDHEAAHCCVRFGRTLFSGDTSIYFWLGNQVGESWSRNAIDSARFLHSRDDLASFLRGLVVFGKHNDLLEILSYLQESIKLFQELGNRHGEALTNAEMGHVLIKLGRLDEAATAFNNALAFSKETDNPRQTVHLTCIALRGLAILKEMSGNIGAAQDYLAATCEFAAGEGSCQPCEATACYALCRLFMASKHYDLALPYAIRAAKLYHLLRDYQDEAQIHFWLANILAQLGDPVGFEEALSQIERASRDLAAHRNQIPFAHADGHLPTGEPETFSPSNEVELRYTAHFKNFTNLFERHEYTLALVAWEGWRPAVEAMNRPQLEAEALGFRGRCHMGLALKELDSAIQAFDRALPLAQSVPKHDLVRTLQQDRLMAHKCKSVIKTYFYY